LTWLTVPGQLAWAAGLVLLGLALPAIAQIPGTSSAQTAPTAEQQAADPLGRDTPSGTILGFNLAVRRGDLVSAAQYLQLTAGQRGNSATLARQLNELIDPLLRPTDHDAEHVAIGNRERRASPRS
jgi:MscS family membrane protein